MSSFIKLSFGFIKLHSPGISWNNVCWESYFVFHAQQLIVQLRSCLLSTMLIIMILNSVRLFILKYPSIYVVLDILFESLSFPNMGIFFIRLFSLGFLQDQRGSILFISNFLGYRGCGILGGGGKK